MVGLRKLAACHVPRCRVRATSACLTWAAVLLLLGPGLTTTTFAASCGDGQLDSDEQCDAGAANGTPAVCCSTTCAFVQPGTPCEPDGNRCIDQMCLSGGNCGFPEVVSCDDGNACTLEHCDPATRCVFQDVVCQDDDICTQDRCDEDAGCEFRAEPAWICLGAQHARLRLATSGAAGADQVALEWAGGPVAPADLGDPATTTSYAACVYDDQGVVLRLSAPAGATCAGGNPCWTVAPGRRIRYRDSRRPAEHGVTRLTASVSPTPQRTARVDLEAGGPGLFEAERPVGLAPQVSAQVTTSDGACFGATFGPGEIRRNDTKRFEARY